MNPLDAYPAVRRALYLVQFIAAGLILLIGVGYGAAGVDLPTWYIVVSAVASGLWSYLGLTAAGNTPVGRRRRDDAGAVTLLEVLVVVLLVVILLAAFGAIPTGRG